MDYLTLSAYNQPARNTIHSPLSKLPAAVLHVTWITSTRNVFTLYATLVHLDLANMWRRAARHVMFREDNRLRPEIISICRRNAKLHFIVDILIVFILRHASHLLFCVSWLIIDGRIDLEFQKHSLINYNSKIIIIIQCCTPFQQSWTVSSDGAVWTSEGLCTLIYARRHKMICEQTVGLKSPHFVEIHSPTTYVRRPLFSRIAIVQIHG